MLRSEFLAEIRASTAALQATISSQGSKIKDIETYLNSVDERLGILERKCQSLERDNEELKFKAYEPGPLISWYRSSQNFSGRNYLRRQRLSVHTGPSHRNRVPARLQDP